MVRNWDDGNWDFIIIIKDSVWGLFLDMSGWDRVKDMIIILEN